LAQDFWLRRFDMLATPTGTIRFQHLHVDIMSLQILVCAALFGAITATKLGDMEQGAKFDKCIAVADWEGKTLDDDITLQDRDANGCCPDNTVPGVEHYTSYFGAQVVCGFEADGTTQVSTSTSNSVKTCTYNQCYVWKQDLPCTGDGKQFLNGCCAAKASCGSNSCGFSATCKNYAYSMSQSKYGGDSEYCLTYHTNYGTIGYAGTAATTDDQADDKLAVDNVYAYASCEGGSSSTPAPAPGVASNSQVARVSVVGMSLTTMVTMSFA